MATIKTVQAGSVRFRCEVGEIYVSEARDGRFWVETWDGVGSHVMDPQPYGTEAAALAAAAEIVAQARP